MTAGPSASVDLDVPSHPDSLLALRAALAALGALAGLTLDDIDDCEIAVEEAGAAVLASRCRRIRLQVLVDAGALHAAVGPGDDPGEWPPPDLTTGLAWRILTGIAEDVGFVDDRIRFSKSTSAR